MIFIELTPFQVRGSAEELREGTEVEFGVYEARPGDKLMAVKIKTLPKGTVKTEDVLEEGAQGEVIKELREPRAFDRQRQVDMLGSRYKFVNFGAPQ